MEEKVQDFYKGWGVEVKSEEDIRNIAADLETNPAALEALNNKLRCDLDAILCFHSRARTRTIFTQTYMHEHEQRALPWH